MPNDRAPEPLAEHFQEAAAIGYLNAEPAIFRGLEVSATGGTAWDGEGEMSYGQISVSLDVPDTHLNFALQLRPDQARKIAYDLLDAVGEEREGHAEVGV